MYVCMYVCVYIHTYIHACIHTYVCMHTYVCKYAHTEAVLSMRDATQVPVLRNRKRVFVFFESPLDTFGPACNGVGCGEDLESTDDLKRPQRFDNDPLAAPVCVVVCWWPLYVWGWWWWVGGMSKGTDASAISKYRNIDLCVISKERAIVRIGHQSRHISLRPGNDMWQTKPAMWQKSPRILVSIPMYADVDRPVLPCK